MTLAELEAGLQHVRESPKDRGPLELIVRRPEIDAREVLDAGDLALADGLVGDGWRTRGDSRTPDRSPNPETQLTIMSARVIALLARERSRWPLAGDQLFLDLDVSAENLPPGTRLALGSGAVIEVTPKAHTGCKKFGARFGVDALKFVNSPRGRELRLRGLNAKVIQPGVIRVGDLARKVDRSAGS